MKYYLMSTHRKGCEIESIAQQLRVTLSFPDSKGKKVKMDMLINSLLEMAADMK